MTPWDHPRSRGENNIAGNALHFAAGSSPLTRGKPGHQGKERTASGIIPAHAGKTSRRRCAAGLRRDHPRSRGENDDGDRRERLQGGSSPLTRGKRRVPRRRVLREGIIPAHAGKTYDGLIPALRSGDHPRSRGENIKAAVSVVVEWGSSPLTRGKLISETDFGKIAGIIPAHAGKT